MSVATSMRGKVGCLLLDRPDKRNPIDVEMIDAIDKGIDELLGQGARAIVIGANGKMFSGGGDVKVFGEALETGLAEALGPTLVRFNAFLVRLTQVPVPVIAAIEGAAAGGGMGLALAADLRVVGRSARLVAAQFRLGATPDGGLTYFLARSLGAPRALKLIMSSGSLDAEELLAAGLTESIVDDGTATEAALALAESYTNIPPLALTHLRQLVASAGTAGLKAQLDAEAAVIRELWRSDDLREGIVAFLERREPQFG